MYHRLRFIITTAIGLMLLSALTACNFRNEPTVVTTVYAFPTNTLAPLVTMTPKFTATPVPSETQIPSITPTPTDAPPLASPTLAPTFTPTASIIGSINFTSPTANLRSGPGQNFSVIIGLKAGTKVVVLGLDDKKDWYNVRLEDGSQEGWLSTQLVTVANQDTVRVLSTADFDQRTKEAMQPTAAADGSTGVGTVVPRKSGIPQKNDVLAYCDNKTNGQPRKTFTTNTSVTIYWWWFSKTPEQLADHISYAEYTVTVDGKSVDDWRRFQSNVIKQPDGTFAVFWFVPIGTPDAGEHKISYKLSWKQKITDGFKSFGPGSDEETNTGTCVFTVK